MQSFWDGFEKRAYREIADEHKKMVLKHLRKLEKSYLMHKNMKMDDKKYNQAWSNFHESIANVSKDSGHRPDILTDWAISKTKHSFE